MEIQECNRYFCIAAYNKYKLKDKKLEEKL